MQIRGILLAVLAVTLTGTIAAETIVISEPMPPPAWALAERELLRANGEGVQAFADRYLDDRGFLECVERWGGNDGPDDAMENFNNWTLLYALGADDSVINAYKKAWEGHLRQYTAARAPGIEMAEHGMYYREFVTAFDWEHNGEGLAAFNFYGLSRPNDRHYRQRMERFAGFYMGDDPEAPNYDKQHKIIKSLQNGSRGPKLTPASEQDWGGLPVPGAPERLTRYATASNIKGDHPLNLAAATLGMNAYMLTGEAKYRDWVLEYIGAWRDRVLQNGGNIPTNIGLDGTIGGEWGGKWWGGTFGWNFYPQSSGRNYFIRGPRIAFGEALMLTGDQSFVEPLRKQIENLYAAKREEGSQILLPAKHGDDGWYGYTRNLRFDVQRDIYLWSMQPADRQKIASDPWMQYLAGENAAYPEEALARSFASVRRRVAGLRADKSTPDTRGSDYSQRFNPASTDALVNLMLGGNAPGTSGNILHSRLRYFDFDKQRAGVPEDVGALVEKITPGGMTLSLVNTNQMEPRTVIVQSGAYGEHQFGTVSMKSSNVEVDRNFFAVRLEPGAGATLEIAMKLFANQPTLAFPWDR